MAAAAEGPAVPPGVPPVDDAAEDNMSADERMRAVHDVVSLWNSAELLVDEDSCAKYFGLVNEFRNAAASVGGGDGDGAAAVCALPDPDGAYGLLQRAEAAIDEAQTLTGSAFEDALKDIRGELLSILQSCNVTEDEMTYAKART